MKTIRLAFLILACAAVPLGTSGCATSVAQWIVKERNHQGDVALAHRNFPDASVAYQLALKIEPTNAHARDGLIVVQLRLAQTFFAASKFDEAIDALAVASHYAPADDRVQSLRGEIEQAEIKRDIVVSNYPSYKVTAQALKRAYNQLKQQNNEILLSLRRFDYTYDTADLAAAIRQSYALNEEVTRLTNRLQQYRQLVESGVPATPGSESAVPPGSLLPLP
jgi:predicted negative regulator of RcsB-dependent stress response